ncbi:oriC-binding nucleoid-associated protein [Salmonella enterica]|nr:oriC-binding nucleoid-associated protein [Salmonella enterica]EHW8353118.1 oriC-binding nucleoid-associated protein [Salmonella enterica]
MNKKLTFVNKFRSIEDLCVLDKLVAHIDKKTDDCNLLDLYTAADHRRAEIMLNHYIFIDGEK